MARTGDIVSLKISGKTAKKKNGKPTGKWIEFKDGDVGRIVYSNSRKRASDVIYVVQLLKGGGLLRLRAQHFVSMRDFDIRLSKSDFEKIDMSALKKDFVAKNAEY